MNKLALRLRFSVFVDRIIVVLIRDRAFLTSAQRRKICDRVRVWLGGMFRSGMRRLQNVRRVRWQHLAWRPIIVVLIVVHVFHRSHWLSGTRGDVCCRGQEQCLSAEKDLTLGRLQMHEPPELPSQDHPNRLRGVVQSPQQNEIRQLQTRPA
jgi:hypothetical protein